MGDFDGAIRDYGTALALDPNYSIAYLDRGNVYRLMGDYPHAIADYDRLIQLEPNVAWNYFMRGVADVYAGLLPKALSDLTQSSKLDPAYPYAALWLDIADKRSNQPSQIAQTVNKIDMTKWPAPVIRMFSGDLTPDQVLSYAVDPGQVCEANFYIGEYDLEQHATDDATRKFRVAAASCPEGYVEWPSAKAELKALGVNPD
jgi:lipoprotein NlpI